MKYIVTLALVFEDGTWGLRDFEVDARDTFEAVAKAREGANEIHSNLYGTIVHEIKQENLK